MTITQTDTATTPEILTLQVGDRVRFIQDAEYGSDESTDPTVPLASFNPEDAILGKEGVVLSADEVTWADTYGTVYAVDFGLKTFLGTDLPLYVKPGNVEVIG